MNDALIKQNIDIPFIKRSYLATIMDLKEVTLVRCDFSIDDYQQELFDELEIRLPLSLINAAKKRQAEFLAGRYAASLALQDLKIENTEVPIGVHRSPVWPDKIVASITHTKNVALCVAAYKRDVCLIGVDLEDFIAQDTLDEIKSMIISPTEETLLRNCSIGFDKAFTLTFSAKESLFKALYPSVGYYFDFSAASITHISPRHKKFELALLKDLTPHLTKGTKFIGHFDLNSSSVLSLIVKVSKEKV